MRIEPERFYRMEMRDFWLAWQGWHDEKDEQQELLKMHAYASGQYTQGKKTMDSIWPTRRKKRIVKSAAKTYLAGLRAKDIEKKIQAGEAIKRAIKKYGGRTENNS
jgi:hypothetical protein